MFSPVAIDPIAFPPLVLLYMPPLLRAKAKAIAAQEPPVHPIWRKFEERGNHFVARTNDLKDIEEVADWAKSWLIEPEEKISRKMRQAFQNVVERTHRHVFFQQVGKYHVIAQGWK